MNKIRMLFYDNKQKVFLNDNHLERINFNRNLINFISQSNKYKMERRPSFVEQLNNQLKEYQIQKITLNQLKYSKNYTQTNQNQAKQMLIDLGDANDTVEIQDHQFSICRWNSKKDIENQQDHLIVTKRNNLLTERNLRYSQNRLKSYSNKHIPHLKLLLQKLQTPTKKKKNCDRGVLTSAPRVKKDIDYQPKILIQKHTNLDDEIFQNKGFKTERKIYSHTPNRGEKKDSENKNPIHYPINEIIKQKRRMKEYHKINRKTSQNWNNIMKNTVNNNLSELAHEKQLLQNLIKNTISNQGPGSKISSQAALHFLDQYNDLNYFSSNFKNEVKKKGTLTNLLI